MKKIKTYFLLISACSISYLTFSQEINKQEIDSAISKVASLVKANYVFEDRGNMISDKLLLLHKQGKFDNIRNWKSFADSLTTTLRYLGKDKHLFVKNDTNAVKELKAWENSSNDSNKDDKEEESSISEKESEAKNFGFREVKILDKNIGYIKLTEINTSYKALTTLYTSMRFISHTKALIIDLRNNGGGGGDVVSALLAYFLPNDVTLLETKNRTGKTSIGKTVSWLTEKKYDNPVYIVVNSKTGSAAEMIAFCLQLKNRAKIVGQPSAGAANMTDWYIINNNLFVSVSVESPTIPGTQISWETTGVIPDYTVDAGNEIDYILKTLHQ